MAAAGVILGIALDSMLVAVVVIGLAALFLIAFRVARQWQKAVILRLGKYLGLKGPGFFYILPFVDTVPYWIDLRTITTPFNAEETLTKDSVPVDVDAVLFWRVVDPKKAAIEVENYRHAIAWASQTALRDVIGRTDLADMLRGREKTDHDLCQMIDQRTEAWGIKALSVEIRDVKIPEGLQNAMSMQAQADRERQARVILADSERQVSKVFEESAKAYTANPVALQLRGMNILLEGMRQNSTIVIVPSSAVETMGLGAMTGLASLAKELADKQGASPASAPSRGAATAEVL
ncbi:MAG: peptidase [Betaproteobacteria bacterium RIFCSPLOWO2_02_FULL_63_19]|nr:MAG: peptidase [Betaproteobacteria bacterium RIFCSPLOWO2_02_FULL_63_19]